MSKKNILIYGSGGLGREIIELIECINKNSNQWEICGFIDDNNDLSGKEIDGYKVYSFEDISVLFNKNNTEIIIAVGEPSIKRVLINKVEKMGYRFPTLIHPNVYISKSAKVGEGSIIKAGCIISTGVTIEKYVLINLGCTIGHDVIIEENSTISLGCNISGNVVINKDVFIGSGVNVRDEISIGEGSIVGIGSVVTKNIRDNMLVYGTPAKEIKSSIGLRIF